MYRSELRPLSMGSVESYHLHPCADDDPPTFSKSPFCMSTASTSLIVIAADWSSKEFVEAGTEL